MGFKIACGLKKKCRKDVLSGLNDTDIRNLHQWGVWVQDSVRELDDNEREQLQVAVCAFAFCVPLVCVLSLDTHRHCAF